MKWETQLAVAAAAVMRPAMRGVFKLQANTTPNKDHSDYDVRRLDATARQSVMSSSAGCNMNKAGGVTSSEIERAVNVQRPELNKQQHLLSPHSKKRVDHHDPVRSHPLLFPPGQQRSRNQCSHSVQRNILTRVIIPAVDTRTETHPGTFSPPPSSSSARSGVLCSCAFCTQASSLNFSFRFF